ncbi:hypothetical protein [Streptomyces sp. SP18CS02]|uniref:hypothetical protein n=1 Tax=Streptomyces sp. SP18CS02 TaxID=3002531 RepID=UPI002E764C5C|nr:hypothetical protein [Streptomyces sp. SP18CS02]MEE1752863.1 hypothetical protein [Streptomyces sp. SP18CS02]
MHAARTFLSGPLRGFSGLIDTNHGDVLAFAEFLGLVDKHPQWDWRRTEVADLLGEPDNT